MKNSRSGFKKYLILASLLTGFSITGCGAAQGSLHAVTVQSNTSAPSAVQTSAAPADTTAPEIEALNVSVPYGSFLRLADIAVITDDQDKSPVLEIVSVVNMDEKAGQNTAAAEAGATLPAAETAATNSTEIAVTAGTVEAAAEAATVGREAASEDEPNEPGYLFSAPGKYSMLLKGTDKSGNESTKTIIVTVTDKTAPVFDGLQENVEITDKDKSAPDYLEGVKAIDEIDGDVTSAITVDDSKVPYGKAGTYSVVYSVADKSGNKAAASVPVTIQDTTAPYFTVITSAFKLFVTDEKPNYASLVTAIDAVDGDVKDSLTVDDSSVTYKYPGDYTATFRVQDKSGNIAEKAVPVIISAGWKTQGGKTYYYSPEDGHLNHNWSNIDGKWYYFDSDDGHMLTGMLAVDGKQYLLDGVDGHMITGWQLSDGKYYYYSPSDGHMYHEWGSIDGKYYYFDPAEGYMLTGAQSIDGKQYLLDSKNGDMLTGWKLIDGKYYYYSPDDGHMYHDWSRVDGKDYFFDRARGYMLTGAQTIDGGQYLFDDVNGDMITGWQLIGGKYYYYSPSDGHMYHDWSTIDGTEYFFDRSDGHMYTGTHYVDGVEYNFGTSGAATKVAQTRSSSSSGSGSNYSYAYIGNRRSKKFHRASCSSVRDMNEGNKVGFDSRSEAIDAGYEPCKRCHP